MLTNIKLHLNWLSVTGLMKWAFWHIHEYYSPQNIFEYKIFIHGKMLRKLKWHLPGEPLAVRYNWWQGPLPGRGPAVQKHSLKAVHYCAGARSVTLFSVFVDKFPQLSAHPHCTQPVVTVSLCHSWTDKLTVATDVDLVRWMDLQGVHKSVHLEWKTARTSQ